MIATAERCDETLMSGGWYLDTADISVALSQCFNVMAMARLPKSNAAFSAVTL